MLLSNSAFFIFAVLVVSFSHSRPSRCFKLLSFFTIIIHVIVLNCFNYIRSARSDGNIIQFYKYYICCVTSVERIAARTMHTVAQCTPDRGTNPHSSEIPHQRLRRISCRWDSDRASRDMTPPIQSDIDSIIVRSTFGPTWKTSVTGNRGTSWNTVLS